MKTWEMIKELTENPEKEFVSISSKDGEASVYATIEHGTIFFRNSFGKSTALYFIDLNWKWEEVKEPVSFMEAVKSGKKVRVEHGFISEVHEKEQFSNHYKHLTELLEVLGTSWSSNDARRILLDGKWYIGD